MKSKDEILKEWQTKPFNGVRYNGNDIYLLAMQEYSDQQNAKLVEENERYKDFHDNWFNVATDYLKLKEENERLNKVNLIKNNLTDELSVLSTKYAVEISELQSELTQAKERIGGLEKEIAKEKEIRIVQLAGISTAAIGYYKEGYGIHEDYDTVALRDVCALYTKYEEKFELVESLESKCKGLEEKQDANKQALISIVEQYTSVSGKTLNEDELENHLVTVGNKLNEALKMYI